MGIMGRPGMYHVNIHGIHVRVQGNPANSNGMSTHIMPTLAL